MGAAARRRRPGHPLSVLRHRLRRRRRQPDLCCSAVARTGPRRTAASISASDAGCTNSSHQVAPAPCRRVDRGAFGPLRRQPAAATDGHVDGCRDPGIRAVCRDRGGQGRDLLAGEVAPPVGVGQLVGHHPSGPGRPSGHCPRLAAAPDPDRHPAGQQGQEQVEPLVHLGGAAAAGVPQRVQGGAAVVRVAEPDPEHDPAVRQVAQGEGLPGQLHRVARQQPADRGAQGDVAGAPGDHGQDEPRVEGRRVLTAVVDEVVLEEDAVPARALGLDAEPDEQADRHPVTAARQLESVPHPHNLGAGEVGAEGRRWVSARTPRGQHVDERCARCRLPWDGGVVTFRDVATTTIIIG